MAWQPQLIFFFEIEERIGGMEATIVVVLRSGKGREWHGSHLVLISERSNT